MTFQKLFMLCYKCNGSGLLMLGTECVECIKCGGVGNLDE